MCLVPCSYRVISCRSLDISGRRRGPKPCKKDEIFILEVSNTYPMADMVLFLVRVKGNLTFGSRIIHFAFHHIELRRGGDGNVLF